MVGINALMLLIDYYFILILFNYFDLPFNSHTFALAFDCIALTVHTLETD